MKKDVVLQPSFFDDFECIGGACKNTCCKDWRIDFTKQEFKNVKRKIHSDAFKREFEDAFTFEKGKCFIKLNEQNQCKFFTEEGLCGLYIEVGYENMSDVCKIYPRSVIKYLDGYERFLSVSCEKVVDLCIEQKDGLQLEVVETELPKLEKDKAVKYDPVLLKNNPQLQIWTDMKLLLLGVLQCREYRFGERMVLLGLATQKIQELFEQKQIEEIQNYIPYFIDDIQQNKQSYMTFFEKMNKDGKKRAIQTLNYYISTKNNDVIQKVIERIDLEKKVLVSKKELEQREEGKKLKTSIGMKYNTEKYRQAMAEFEEFLKDKEYWIENVMIEGLLATKGFYRVSGGFWRNYCAIAVTYSIYLFMMTCCLEKDSTKEDFKYYTTQVARTLFHSDVYTKQLEEHLKETESDSLAHIAVLVL